MRLLISYMSIFLGIICVLCILFFLIFSQTIQLDMDKLNHRYADSELQAIDFQLREIDQSLIKDIQTSELLPRFFSGEGVSDSLLNADIVAALNGMVLQHPLISTVYAVRFQDGKVLSNDLSVQLKDFGDNSFVIHASPPNTPLLWSGLRTFRELDSVNPMQVVSLVRKYPILTGEQGIMVINISKQNLVSFMHDLNQDTANYVELFDSNHKLITGLQNESINEQKGPPITTLRSEYTGWILNSGLQSTSGKILWSISRIRAFWLIGGLLLIMLGMSLIVWVSRRNYRPVRNLATKLNVFYSQTDRQPVQQPLEDFRMIEQSIGDLMEISQKYQKQTSEVQQLSQLRFFREVIEGKCRIDMNDWNSAMLAYGMPSNLLCAHVILLEIDQYASFLSIYNASDQNLLKYVVGKVWMEEADAKPSLHVWLEWISPLRLGAVIRYDQPEDEVLVYRLCGQLQNWIKEHLKFTVSIGIGGKVGEPGRLVESYEQADEAMKYKMVLGPGALIDYKEVPFSEDIGLFDHLVQFRNVVDLYRLGKEGWERKITDIFNSFQTDWLSYDDIISLLNYFIFYLNRELNKLPDELYLAWKERVYETLIANLESIEQLDVLLNHWLILLRESQSIFIDRLQSMQHYVLIREVRSYIEANYQDPDMSLVTLSDRFQLSPKYLSQLYKEAFGEKFIDVLHQLRMEQSKKLLANTTIPVQDIAFQVGYTNSISFSQAFKKYMGIPPSYYRRTANVKSLSEKDELDGNK